MVEMRRTNYMYTLVRTASLRATIDHYRARCTQTYRPAPKIQHSEECKNTSLSLSQIVQNTSSRLTLILLPN